jgi:MFS family permease
VFVAGLAVVEPRPAARARRGEARLRESLALVRRTPRLLAFLLIVTAVGFASDPINTEAPAFAREFGYRDTVAGLIIGAFGFGAVSAAFLLAGRVTGSRRRMVATLTLLGLGVVGFSISPWLAVGFLFLVLAGFGYLASNTPRPVFSSRSRRGSGGGSWRSGASRFWACGRLRVSSTERSQAPSASA